RQAIAADLLRCHGQPGRGGIGAPLHRAGSRRGPAWLPPVVTTPSSDSSPVRADRLAGNGLHFRNLGPPGSSSTVSLAASPTVEVIAMVADPLCCMARGVSGGIPWARSTRAASRRGWRLEDRSLRPSSRWALNLPRRWLVSSMTIRRGCVIAALLGHRERAVARADQRSRCACRIVDRNTETQRTNLYSRTCGRLSCRPPLVAKGL